MGWVHKPTSRQRGALAQVLRTLTLCTSEMTPLSQSFNSFWAWARSCLVSMSCLAFLKISKHIVAKKGKCRKTDGGLGISEKVGSTSSMGKLEENGFWSEVDWSDSVWSEVLGSGSTEVSRSGSVLWDWESESDVSMWSLIWFGCCWGGLYVITTSSEVMSEVICCWYSGSSPE